MAVDRANIITICSFRKGKGLFSYENKPQSVWTAPDCADSTKSPLK